MDSVLKSEYTPTTVESIKSVPGFVQTIRHVLSPEECNQIIQIAEKTGFVAASLYTDHSGIEHFSDVRKSSRCIIDSIPFAEELWRRIQHIIPPVWKNGHKVVGVNERLRILRYYPGDEFKPHSDGHYHAPNGDESRITILLYLNEGYEGGFTCFYTGETTPWHAIQPEIGMAAIQDQDLLHGVPPLQKGVKYAIRTEVMYRPPPKPVNQHYKDIVIQE
jgi:hypothetical protein